MLGFVHSRHLKEQLRIKTYQVLRKDFFEGRMESRIDVLSVVARLDQTIKEAIN